MPSLDEMRAAANIIPGQAAGDLTFAGVTPDPSTSYGGGQRQVTTNAPDPWREFLLNTIMQKTGEAGKVPDYTMASLENFTRNPAAAAADFFPQLVDPLLRAQMGTEGREQTQLNDMFRKAGGTGSGAMQSGAYAQAGRQLIGDQASRRQELLARNYIPLTGQISENINNAIRSGLSVPGTTSELIKPLAGLASSLAPLSTTTEQGTQTSTFSPAVRVAGMQQQPAAPTTPSWLQPGYNFA